MRRHMRQAERIRPFMRGLLAPISKQGNTCEHFILENYLSRSYCKKRVLLNRTAGGVSELKTIRILTVRLAASAVRYLRLIFVTHSPVKIT